MRINFNINWLVWPDPISHFTQFTTIHYLQRKVYQLIVIFVPFNQVPII